MDPDRDLDLLSLGSERDLDLECVLNLFFLLLYLSDSDCCLLLADLSLDSDLERDLYRELCVLLPLSLGSFDCLTIVSVVAVGPSLPLYIFFSSCRSFDRLLNSSSL